ncbi:hypothetical protein TUMEXPCC7403_25290 [Tumidithrix helvetica PCC 7403]|uniref:hypothetical protein n=1 Tax=Tumidithrix helvetica TaxID=3457545 RepID=UPI003C8F8EB5
MGKETKSVTFRCPDDVYQALSNFALDKSITKDDKPIISEALVTALRIGLGLNEDVPTSNAVNKDALQQIQEQIDDLSNKLSNTVSKDELKEAIARLEVTEPAKKVSVTDTESSLETEVVPVVNASSGMSRDAAHAIARARGCRAEDPKSFSDGFTRSEELQYGFTRVKLNPELKKRYKTGSTDKYWYFDTIETHNQ